MEDDLQQYLQPTYFIDSDAVEVINFAVDAVDGKETSLEKGVAIFYAVRDKIRYDPYKIDLERQESFKASNIISRGYGYCVAKAIVLAAAARAAGIPSRLGFADVRNHLSTKKLRQLMKTDTFIFHGYAELFLENSWVKATPTFNMSLCDKFGVKPLDFNGKSDSLFHPYDREGKRHMEYIRDHGNFVDVPYERIITNFKKYYPAYFRIGGITRKNDFEKEAASEKK
ncbi:MAG TPA: transglutaminase family protein [Syntrophales bacterium]|nr:transglutaminase family protein [Syntrophales bacterium]